MTNTPGGHWPGFEGGYLYHQQTHVVPFERMSEAGHLVQDAPFDAINANAMRPRKAGAHMALKGKSQQRSSKTLNLAYCVRLIKAHNETHYIVQHPGSAWIHMSIILESMHTGLAFGLQRSTQRTPTTNLAILPYVQW